MKKTMKELEEENAALRAELEELKSNYQLLYEQYEDALNDIQALEGCEGSDNGLI